MKDFDQIHDIILEKLDTIESQLGEVKTQTTKTNGRVTDLEKETIAMKKDIAQSLKIISGHSSIITYYKQERDKVQEDLIKQLQIQLTESQRKSQEEKEERDEAYKLFNRRVMYTLISVVLFILVTLKLVSLDLVRVILTGL